MGEMAFPHSEHQVYKGLGRLSPKSAGHVSTVRLFLGIAFICLLHFAGGHCGLLHRLSRSLGAGNLDDFSLRHWIRWAGDYGRLDPLIAFALEG